jgi:uncharacterized protein involved in exopolysaccharide biosynthesis
MDEICSRSTSFWHRMAMTTEYVGDPGPGLWAYLAPARHRWWLVVATTVLTAVIAGVISHSRPKEYTAQAQLVFRGGSDALAAAQPSDPSGVSDTDAALAALPSVLTMAASSLGDKPNSGTIAGMVSASPQGSTNLVDVNATSASPVTAARVANAVANSVVEFESLANQQYAGSVIRSLQSALKQLPSAEASGPVATGIENNLQQEEIVRASAQGDAQVIPADSLSLNRLTESDQD